MSYNKEKKRNFSLSQRGGYHPSKGGRMHFAALLLQELKNWGLIVEAFPCGGGGRGVASPQGAYEEG